MNSQKNYWLELAEYDLDTARVMLGGNKFLYVAFMCHQVIEKSFKAVISLNKTPPKVHNLLRLSELAGLLVSMTDEQQEFIEDLNPMYIETRYPVYKDKISSLLTAERCKELIQLAEEMLNWIKKQL